MASVCFYFQVHQPYRLRHYTIFDTGTDYFDQRKNAEICRKVACKCYLPTNRLLLELIEKYAVISDNHSYRSTTNRITGSV
jgi:alpha-amylase